MFSIIHLGDITCHLIDVQQIVIKYKNESAPISNVVNGGGTFNLANC